jgi:PKD repeat protein
MSARLALLFALAIAATTIGSCSSGLGNNLPDDSAPVDNGDNPNLPVGLDVGVMPTSPIGEPAVAGVVVPAIGAAPQREIVLLAFSTAANAADADGVGGALSRDAVTDANSQSDVFVAAICAQDIDPRAFSQSLAGKFRHPRCATCHSMERSDTLAFTSSPQAHAGPAPGSGFPINAPETCAPCHVNSTNFPVPGWQAPAASFDLRSKTVAELAQAAQGVPADETEHFVTDPRVLWALDSGVLPQVGGRNGRADDDHDGVLEPEDSDGVNRTVPGGSRVFLEEIEAWRESGLLVSNAAAVKDITLASRASGGSAAPNGASGAPRVLWVPNGAFNPAAPVASNPIGTLFVVYQSTGSDIAGTDNNGASDVFRAAVQLRAAADGSLDLLYVSTELCSATNGTSIAGDAASTAPAIGGANGTLVVFQSVATNLVAGDGNGASDVFVRTAGSTSTLRLSLGNAASEAPAIDPTGTTVAFESDATDLIAGDQNGERDVFFVPADGSGSPTRASVTGNGSEGTGGASSAASVHVAGGRTRVVFQSNKTNLATGLVAATNVYLFDSAQAGTTLLNQRVSPSGDAIGNGSARAPVITADGSVIAFESEASNIDALRPTDGNRASDVFLLETTQLASGNVLPFRISVAATSLTDGNGASTRPTAGVFTGSANFQTGFIAYSTAATNLGTADSTPIMVSFLDETSGVTADFTTDVTRGAAPLTVQFTDRSLGSPTAWQWDFDNDGNVDSTLQNPSFTYTTPGTYDVRLVATNEVGSVTETKAAVVTVFEPVVAGFTPSTTSGPAPLAVTFTNTSTGAASFLWDFGDGTSSTATSPVKTFASGGSFLVTLTATGPGGVDTETRTITAASSASFTITAGPGQIGASTTAYESTTLTFTSTSTGSPTSFSWDFDSVGAPGTLTATGSTVNRSFPGTTSSTRTFVVRLTVNGPGGQAQTTRNLIIVSDTETATLQAAGDTTIYSESTGFSNGAGAKIVVGSAYSGVAIVGFRRSPLRFDLSGTVPNTSTINSVQVQLTLVSPTAVAPTANQNTGDRNIRFRRLTTAWTEGTTAPAAFGQGIAATGGDATWASPWTTAGGDVAQSSGNPINSTTLVVGNTLQAYTTTNGAQMVADVQGWANDPATNFGWLLVGDEIAARTVKFFEARNPSSTTPGEPRLVVGYTRPLF